MITLAMPSERVQRSIDSLLVASHTDRPERRRARPHPWMAELAARVWEREGLPPDELPLVLLGSPARSTKGYFNASSRPPRIVVRRDPDRHTMRNTLLHELAHAVHRLHVSDDATCSCQPRCARDGHGPVFKRHLARIEHRFQAGTHSRWGLAGCLGRARVSPQTAWHARIACPRQGSPPSARS